MFFATVGTCFKTSFAFFWGIVPWLKQSFLKSSMGFLIRCLSARFLNSSHRNNILYDLFLELRFMNDSWLVASFIRWPRLVVFLSYDKWGLKRHQSQMVQWKNDFPIGKETCTSIEGIKGTYFPAPWLFQQEYRCHLVRWLRPVCKHPSNWTCSSGRVEDQQRLKQQLKKSSSGGHLPQNTWVKRERKQKPGHEIMSWSTHMRYK